MQYHYPEPRISRGSHYLEPRGITSRYPEPRIFRVSHYLESRGITSRYREPQINRTSSYLELEALCPGLGSVNHCYFHPGYLESPISQSKPGYLEPSANFLAVLLTIVYCSVSTLLHPLQADMCNFSCIYIELLNT